MAQPPPPKAGVTAIEVAAWLKQGGFSAQVEPDTTTPGDQIVATAMDGVDAEIYLYDCQGDGEARRCRSIQYVTGWTPLPGYTVDKANAWNASRRFIKAYITPQGALYGEFDVDLGPAGPEGMLDDSLLSWRTMLVQFKTFFGS